MPNNVLGRVRKLMEGVDAAGADVEAKVRTSLQLELLVANGAAPYSEITRLGRSFYCVSPTARAAVVAPPTTAFLLALYNNEPEGGDVYFIDWVSATCAASTNLVGSQAQLMVGQGQVREAIPTDSGIVLKKANGLGTSFDTRARTVDNSTSPTALSWAAVGATGVKQGLAVTPGYGVFADLGGRLVVAPGRYFAMTVIAALTGETFYCAMGWHEAQTQLG